MGVLCAHARATPFLNERHAVLTSRRSHAALPDQTTFPEKLRFISQRDQQPRIKPLRFSRAVENAAITWQGNPRRNNLAFSVKLDFFSSIYSFIFLNPTLSFLEVEMWNLRLLFLVGLTTGFIGETVSSFYYFNVT